MLPWMAFIFASSILQPPVSSSHVTLVSCSCASLLLCSGGDFSARSSHARSPRGRFGTCEELSSQKKAITGVFGFSELLHCVLLHRRVAVGGLFVILSGFLSPLLVFCPTHSTMPSRQAEE